MATLASAILPESTDRERYLGRVRDLEPLIAKAAEGVDRERRLDPELLAGLYEAGLFRLLLEKRFNGGEVCPSDFSRIIEEVAKHDAFSGRAVFSDPVLDLACGGFLMRPANAILDRQPGSTAAIAFHYQQAVGLGVTDALGLRVKRAALYFRIS